MSTHIVYENNPAEYKRCKKKSHTIHVCMPPLGTVVVNRLEQFDTVKALEGRTYFTADEILNFKANDVYKFNYIAQLIQAGKAYNVDELNRFVLAGVLGELYTITPTELQRRYTFVEDDKPVLMNAESLNKRTKNGLLPWTRVRSVQNSNDIYFACFKPSNQICQIRTKSGMIATANMQGVKHGKGDFIVAENIGGTPNLSRREVVNGEVFARTYDNHGWSDCLAPQTNTINIEIKDLPDLLPKTNGGDAEYKSFISKMSTYYARYISNTPVQDITDKSGNYCFVIGKDSVVIKLYLKYVYNKWTVTKCVAKVNYVLNTNKPLSEGIFRYSQLQNEESLYDLYEKLTSPFFTELLFNKEIVHRLEDVYHVNYDPDVHFTDYGVKTTDLGYNMVGDFTTALIGYNLISKEYDVQDIIMYMNTAYHIVDGSYANDNKTYRISKVPSVSDSGICTIGITIDGKDLLLCFDCCANVKHIETNRQCSLYSDIYNDDSLYTTGLLEDTFGSTSDIKLMDILRSFNIVSSLGSLNEVTCNQFAEKLGYSSVAEVRQHILALLQVFYKLKQRLYLSDFSIGLSRIEDSVSRRNFDDYEVSVDYTFKYNGNTIYGYAQLGSNGTWNFATWLDDKGEQLVENELESDFISILKLYYYLSEEIHN